MDGREGVRSLHDPALLAPTYLDEFVAHKTAPQFADSVIGVTSSKNPATDRRRLGILKDQTILAILKKFLALALPLKSLFLLICGTTLRLLS